jgi:ribonuclease HII
MLSDLLDYEKHLFDKGVRLIAGVDEVGRGPLAGPFVAGAVVLDLEKIIQLADKYNGGNGITRNNDVPDGKILNSYNQIRDSKKLTSKKRTELNEFLTSAVISYSIVEISSEELDEIGISETTQRAFYSCIQNLKIKPEHVLTDAFPIKKIVSDYQTNIKEGDNKSISIASASIMAKVYRDNLMDKMHLLYPQYGFDRNKGYGTREHLNALGSFGVCPIHRRSFHPVSLCCTNL